ncbi:MAG: hypothetical protein MZV49_24435 [Rhodopseudomonas palustris]|nr:hypothetical protein [Rhodopseudomonas palustris]
MYWADELAASVEGPQVVNDSKTPSGTRPRRQPARPRHPRRHHPRPARSRPAHDAPLRRRRHGPDGCPGAPDARRGRARDGPSAGARPRPGRRLPRVSYARHSRRRPSSTSFAGLGIHPDRYYWMSDIYPTGRDGPVHPDRPRPGPGGPRRLPPRVSKVERPRAGCPSTSSAPTCGKVGTTIAARLGRRDGRLRVPPRLRDLGPRLRRSRPDRPVRRHRQAALEPRVGGPVEPLRRDDRALRQGPRHGGRLAATAPTRIAREVFDREPPLNLPTSSSTSAGARCRTSKGAGAAAHEIGRGPAAGAAALPVPAATAPNQAIEFDPEGTDADPAPVRRARPARRRRRRARRYRGELPPDPSASSATSCSTRTRTPPRPPQPTGPPSATSPSSPRSPASTSPPAWPRRRALPLTRRRGSRPSPSASPPRAPGSRPTPRTERGRRVRRDALPAEADRPSARTSASSCSGLAIAAERERPRRRRRLAGRSSSGWPARRGARGRRAPSAPLYLAVPRPARTARAAGWLLASLDARLRRSRRLREAGRLARSAGEAERAARRPGHERRAAAAPRGAGGRSARARSTRARTPSLVDVALELDARRRGLLGEADGLKAERNAASKQVGEAIRGGAAPDGPEVAALQGRVGGSRRADRGARRRGRRRSRPSSTTLAAADPQPGRPGRPGRRRRRQRRRTHLGRAAPRVVPSRERADADRAAPGSAGPTGRSPRRSTSSTSSAAAKITGSGFPVYKGAGAAPPARAHRLLPRRPHRARTASPRSGRRPSSTRRRRAGPARSRTRKTRCTSSPATSCYLVPDGRGPGHEPPPRRDPRGRRSCPIRYAAYSPCFRREAGAAGKDTRGILRVAPVRQGRDGAVRAAGGVGPRRSSG